jgi:hypothetical protein
MFIYNTTFNIEESTLENALDKIENHLIPQLLGTELFTKALLTEVFETSAENAKTFSLQLFCPSKNHFSQYQKFHDNKFVELIKPFKGKVVYFQTLMQIKSVHDHS